MQKEITKLPKKRGFIKLVLVLIILAIGLNSFGQTRVMEGIAYPIPPKTKNRLFYLQRTPNTNTIVCDLNIKNGEVVKDKPLTTYWLRYGDAADGPKKELSFIQRNFAYGLNIENIGTDKYEFWFVSYKKYHMYLFKTPDNSWSVYGKINNKLTKVSSIFLCIKGGSFWFPHVEYVELRGNNLKDGSEEIQRLTDVKRDPS